MEASLLLRTDMYPIIPYPREVTLLFIRSPRVRRFTRIPNSMSPAVNCLPFSRGLSVTSTSKLRKNCNLELIHPRVVSSPA